jgi:hypothetical protein
MHESMHKSGTCGWREGRVLAGLDFDQGALAPCRAPSNPQPSWRAAAHHLIRMRALASSPKRATILRLLAQKREA